MEIRVYDKELNFKGIIENHTSLIWTRKYFEPGNFELHAPITEANLSLLIEGNIITKRDSKEAGVIEDIEDEESDVKNEITIKGNFISSYANRRLIKNTVTFNGKVEIAMRQLVSAVAPIPKILLGKIVGFSENVDFQVTMKNLQSYLIKLARYSGLGWRFRVDFKEKKIYFEVYKGVERTMSQGINARVIFSESYENLNNAIYKYNNQSYKTLAIVGGEGDGVNRKYVVVGGGNGLELREIFVDAKDIRSEGLSVSEYEALLRQRGNEALEENKISESLECETEASINFTYKVHYDLGDVVTINKKKWGIKVDKRITEIQEVYEYGGMTVVPTFGDPLPETIDLTAE